MCVLKYLYFRELILTLMYFHLTKSVFVLLASERNKANKTLSSQKIKKAGESCYL